MIFDTLDYLEAYKPVVNHMQTIIDILDRSLPYEEDVGRHVSSEDKDLVYIIDSHLSSSKGFEAELNEGKDVMEIVLEGEEIVSVSGSVVRLSPGRFLIYSGDEKARRGIAESLPVAFKAVRFLI